MSALLPPLVLVGPRRNREGRTARPEILRATGPATLSGGLTSQKDAGSCVGNDSGKTSPNIGLPRWRHAFARHRKRASVPQTHPDLRLGDAGDGRSPGSRVFVLVRPSRFPSGHRWASARRSQLRGQPGLGSASQAGPDHPCSLSLPLREPSLPTHYRCCCCQDNHRRCGEQLKESVHRCFA